MNKALRGALFALCLSTLGAGRAARAEPAVPDPLFPAQWYAEKTGMPAAFEITEGRSDVVIAVIDDGFDLAHEDLGGLAPGMWDFADGDAVPEAGPLDDHGTAVLGIAAARAGNGLGIIGACPRCGVLPIRRGFSEADDALAIRHAVDSGADVILCSWGYTHPSVAVTAAIEHAVTAGRDGKGAVVVFAAGNEGVDVAETHDIAATRGVLAVMATGPDDHLLPDSSTGDRAVAAPAGGLWTTDRTSGGYAAGSYTNEFGGTSGAAPQIAGAAALVLSVDPTLPAEAVIALLRDSADLVPGRPGSDTLVPRLAAGRAVAWAAGMPDPPETGAPEDEEDELSGCVMSAVAPGRGALWIALAALALLGRRRRGRGVIHR